MSWLATRDIAEIKVLDRGPGVPRGCEEKVFEKFYRAHDSLSSGIQGSGLGLTIARQIARAHGARYEAEQIVHISPRVQPVPPTGSRLYRGWAICFQADSRKVAPSHSECPDSLPNPGFPLRK